MGKRKVGTAAVAFLQEGFQKTQSKVEGVQRKR
jgi:hypothetical protein